MTTRLVIMQQSLGINKETLESLPVCEVIELKPVSPHNSKVVVVDKKIKRVFIEVKK